MKAPAFSTELVPIESLKPHPKNYRKHLEEQLDHIAESVKANGIYKNIVVSSDGVILAGHGVYEACKARLKIPKVPIIRLALKSTSRKAMKILAGDNEMSKLAEVDDRLLSDILKDISDGDDLLGTGFDKKMLANLIMVTRPESEIADENAAAHWVGMPEFEPGEETWRVIVHCRTQADRAKFLKYINAKVINKTVGKTASIYWPEKPKQDLKSVRFSAKGK